MALAKLLLATTADQLVRHDTSLIIRLFEVAVLVKSEKLPSAPRTALLDVLWSQRADETLNLTLLGLGKHNGDKMIVGAAYYSIMRYGEEWWSSCDALDASDRKRLTDGMMRCAQQSHVLNRRWLADGIGCGSMCSRSYDVLTRSAQKQIERDIKFYDILGIVSSMDLSNELSTAGYSSSSNAEASRNLLWAMTRLKQELPNHFSDTGAQ